MHRVALAVCLGTLAMAGVSRGGTIVVPNANTATEGASYLDGPFQGAAISLQWQLAGSQFASVPVGSQLTAIGFRLDGGDTNEPLTTETFTSWNLQLSASLNAIGSLSTTFANNIGAGDTSVYSGPLTILAGSLTGGAGPNPFFFVTFTTPYIYNGGDVLLTLNHVASNGPSIRTDGVGVSAIGDTVLQNDFSAVTGVAEFYNLPVTAFQFTPTIVTPEPATWLSLAGGLIVLGWRKRRAA